MKLTFESGVLMGVIFGLILSFILYTISWYIQQDINKKEKRMIELLAKKISKGEIDARIKDTSNKCNR